tara:strand:+ start:188 stop:451 length:264 start_codon:yes stop_codon:yes gene_type:complete
VEKFNQILLNKINLLISERDLYTKRIDFVVDNEFYKGEASVGSLVTDSVWRINKTTISEDGDVSEVWAGGSADFNKVWEDRTLLSYV